jgi:hypothetical protein
VHGSNHGNVIQLEDISIYVVSDDVQSVHVRFRRFKHFYVGTTKVVSFSHGDTKISAVKMLIDFLQHRYTNGGQLYCMQDGIPICRSHFVQIVHKCLSVCGLDSSRYIGHRFRIGAATLVAEKGLSNSQIRVMGRSNSNAFRKYIPSNYMS